MPTYVPVLVQVRELAKRKGIKALKPPSQNKSMSQKDGNTKTECCTFISEQTKHTYNFDNDSLYVGNGLVEQGGSRSDNTAGNTQCQSLGVKCVCMESAQDAWDSERIGG